MKIFILIKGLGLGGAERHVVDSAKAFVKRGHEVEVGFLLPYKQALVSELREAGIACNNLGGEGLWPLAMWANFRRAVAAFAPDVVHAHLPVAGVLARSFKPLFGYRLVYTEHNLIWQYRWLSRLLHRLTWQLDDVAVSCSQPVADALSRASVVVDNGLGLEPVVAVEGPSLRSRFNIASNALLLLCVANLRPQKNHALLLRAFDALLHRQPALDAHLVLVGQDATDRPAVEALRNTLAAASRIHFYGSHPRAAALMPEADLFCLSSDAEGLPISLLESMAAGIPALVTAVGGMPQVVVHGTTGLMVAAGDLPAYTIALQTLATDSELRLRMGKAAAERVANHYSQEAMIDHLLKLYARAEPRP